MSLSFEDIAHRPWLSGKEAAVYTGISWPALRELAIEHQIPHLRVGRRWRFQRVVLDEHLALLAEREAEWGGAA